jgi:hypothetical protein
MSKFDYGSFSGGYDEFAVNAEKYTYEEAIKIFEEEYDYKNNKVGSEIGQYIVSNAFVKWRAGINEDHEACVCWWLEYTKRPKGSCPVYAFHKRQKNDITWGNEI